MKIYEEIQQNLAADKISILFSEWNVDARGNVSDLKQHVELRAPEEAKTAQEEKMFAAGRPVIKKTEGHIVMTEPFFPEDRLIVLGGGHVALPLVEFAAKTGFSVTLVDDRLAFANTERFPWAAHVICDSFGHAIRELKIRRQDYVCILTRGHRWDMDCLREILSGEEPGYFGMIGSRRRVAIVKENLIGEGFSAAALGRLYSPIGLNIGGVTPQEIAVSILAELIRVKRLGTISKSLRNQSDLDYAVVDRLANEKGVPKAVITIISANGSVPRGAGAKMIAYADGNILGSIGGGCNEAAVLTVARSMIGTDSSRLLHVDLTGAGAENDGMVCGGVMDVLIQAVQA